MEEAPRHLARCGISIPDILLPRQGIDLEKWAVIACDQFTQDPGYWDRVRQAAGEAPSTLNLILPEIYLQGRDRAARIQAIHQHMAARLRDGTFAPPRQGCVYLERNTPHHQGRRGLVIALDLEHYDWAPAARPLIRATEGVVPERLPPRMEVRRGAALESPHILLLIDDEQDEILPALGERAKQAAPAYQSPLMLGGGDISGWFLDNAADWAFLGRELDALARRSVSRYTPGAAPFLFAAGDGNHSLAAAREIWLEYKTAHAGDPSLMSHPCRYALAEIENLYDPAIQFEPIHRVLFNISLDQLLARLSTLPGFSSRPVESGTPGDEAAGRAALSRLVAEPAARTRLGLVAGNRRVLVETAAPGLATVSLQPLLDQLAQPSSSGGISGSGAEPAPSIDYIHGEDEVFRLASARTVGILLPPVPKSGLFETVARTGPLPRKSFSMGEAVEKRYYLECRKIAGSASP